KLSEVQAALQNAAAGLPAKIEYPSTEYKPTLSLEGVTQPTIAVGADRFGAAVAGGIAFLFSDLLGDHTLRAAVQVNSGTTGNFDLKNTAAQVAYLNQAHRLNWGVIAGQIPYLSGGFLSGIANVGGEPAEVDQSVIFRQTEQSVAGIVAYPFNRAQR